MKQREKRQIEKKREKESKKKMGRQHEEKNSYFEEIKRYKACEKICIHKIKKNKFSGVHNYKSSNYTCII